MIDRVASLQPAGALKQQVPLVPRGGGDSGGGGVRFLAPEEERACLPSGSVHLIPGEAIPTTDWQSTAKQTNKQTAGGYTKL